MAEKNQSIMEKLKQNPGLIAAAGLAVAAGIVIYNNMSRGGKKSSSNKKKADGNSGQAPQD